MSLLGKLFKLANKPVRAQIHGAEGERKVENKLNPLIFGRVEHRQLNNIILVDDNGKSHQIDHIEIRSNGVFCIETKNYKGWVFGDENSQKWTQTLYNGEKHQFYNPLKQNKSHCYQISRVIGRKYKVNSVIVMANNNADKIKCSNVINLNDLSYYLKSFNNDVCLSEQEMDKIYYMLNSASSSMTTRQHIQNIRETQKEIDNNICPRCGGKMVLRNGKNGNFYGCSNYPKCKFTKRYSGSLRW